MATDNQEPFNCEGDSRVTHQTVVPNWSIQ